MNIANIRSRFAAWRQKVARAHRRISEHTVRAAVVRHRVRHLFGPAAIDYGPDEVVVTCVVRNGAEHVRSFIEHHTDLGVRHIVFLDNGSTDGTLEIVRQYDNVTALATDCPYHRYENPMKRYLAERFSRGRWNLFVDVDELFDYPFSSEMPLRSLIEYLNSRGYTAVVAQMLDMFSGEPLSDVETPDPDLRRAYPFYDISAIRRIPYRIGTPAHPAIHEHFGGIRSTVFGTDLGLTKAPLALVEDPRRMFKGWHHVEGARLADFSCVLLHFPFVRSFPDKVREAVRTRRYGSKFTPHYDRYGKVLEEQPELSLRGTTAKRLRSVDDLVAEGFLVVSDAYRGWADDHRGQVR